MEQTRSMKNLYRLLLLALGFMPIVAQAQLANQPIFVETLVHHSDYGDPGHNLAGFVTYKVYVQFTAPNNYLTSIFATEGNQTTPADCILDNINYVSFNFDSVVFQHELSGALGSSQFCLYPFAAQASEFDSYLTIGQRCQSDLNFDLTGTLGTCLQWQDDFEGPIDLNYYDGGDFFWDEYTIYSIPTGASPSLSLCDANNRVFIGQFTTSGDMQGFINIQYETPNGVTTNQALEVPIIGIHPCLNDPMDNTPVVTNPCFDGELATVELGIGGNDSVYYYLYNTANTLVYSDSLLNGGFMMDALQEGSYYIMMRDKAGCRDTTENFNVNFPASFTFSAELLTDELCYGENAGSIQLNCSGGTGQITIVDNGGTSYACGQIIDGLTCGDFVFSANDQNNCAVDQVVSISCPDALHYTPQVTNIVCFGDDNGVIAGNVTGGTGNITATWTNGATPVDVINGNSPLNITINNLDGGNYDVLIVDANGCELSNSAAVSEPDEIIATFEVIPASCFAFCDGLLISNANGGTGNLTTTTTNENGVNTPLNALCAGWYDVKVTDQSGCFITDSIEVTEPTDITYSADTTNLTCYASCDGLLELFNVDGSFGGFTYTVSPNTPNCAGGCNGSDVQFNQVCAGNYTVTITDQNGCEKDVSYSVDQPDPLQFTYTPTNVTCFTFNDGIVTVDEVIGGTEPFSVNLNNTELLPLEGNSTYTDLVPGDYQLLVSDSNNCSATENFTITEPERLSITIDTTIACSCGGICDGLLQYTPAGGTPNYQYLLKPDSILGPGFGVVNGLCAGDFEIFLIDSHECVDSAEFTITEPDPLTLEILLDAPTCTGMNDGSAEITVGGGTGALSFYVDPNDYSAVPLDSVTFGLSDLIEDSLYFELADENGCRIFDTLSIVPDIITDMILTMSQTPETCWNALDGTANVAVQNGNPPLSYEWDDNLLQTTATAMGLAPNTDYTVKVTDAIGCNLTSNVFVEANIGCFFIATAITPNGDGVNDTWVLGGFEYYPECKVNVFNRWGQTIFSSTGYNSQWDGRFNGQLLPVADYYFTIDYAADKEVIMGTVTLKY